MRSIPIRFVFLSAALFASILIGLAIGSVPISMSDLFSAVLGQTEHTLIVRELRLPRLVLAALAGGGLAAAGAAYQGLFRNPLADPFVIGSASGSALGATIVLFTGFSSGWLGLSAVPAGAFIGSLTATLIVFTVAAVGRTMNLTKLLLAGAAIGSVFNALAWILLMVGDKPLSLIVNTLLGSLSGRTWSDVISASPWIVVGFLGLLTMSRPLDALSAGEDVARGLGLRVRLAVALVMTFAGLLVAAAVAAGGVIGFIGLVAPYLARPLVGHRHLAVIPASALIGAIILIWSDTLARTIVAPSELPVGVITALIAGPFFFIVIKRGSR